MRFLQIYKILLEFKNFYIGYSLQSSKIYQQDLSESFTLTIVVREFQRPHIISIVLTRPSNVKFTFT